MKKVFLVVISLLLVSCFEALDPTGDETDDNDTMSKSERISLGEINNAKILPEGDVDYFELDISKSSVYLFNFDNVPSSIDLYLDVLDFEGTDVFYSSVSTGSSWIGRHMNSGMYYLKLSDRYSYKESNTAFSFSVIEDTIDVSESNNLMSSACEIFLDNTLSGAIFPTGDRDYYKFTLSENTIVKFKVDSVSSKIDPQFDLYDIEGTSLLSRYFSAGQNIDFSKSLHSGTYYVRLTDHWDSDWSRTQYFLNVSKDMTDSTEWNDDSSSAYPISMGTLVSAAIYPVGDVDYYRFTVSSPDTIVVSIDSVSSKTNLDSRIRDSEFTSISYLNKAAGESHEHRLYLTPGMYYLAVWDHWDDDVSGRNHVISIRQIQ